MLALKGLRWPSTVRCFLCRPIAIGSAPSSSTNLRLAARFSLRAAFSRARRAGFSASSLALRASFFCWLFDMAGLLLFTSRSTEDAATATGFAESASSGIADVLATGSSDMISVSVKLQ